MERRRVGHRTLRSEYRRERPEHPPFFEQYADVAAAERHQSTEAYRRFNEALPKLVDGDIEAV
jgi:quinol monooxygenase YgiN